MSVCTLNGLSGDVKKVGAIRSRFREMILGRSAARVYFDLIVKNLKSLMIKLFRIRKF